MIDLTPHAEQIEKNARLCAQKNILLPTYEEMADPSKIDDEIKKELETIGRDEVHSRNLFRVTWENEPVESGGGFADPTHLELPKEITGVDARIVGLAGTFFPTGAHKVGAAYSCLMPTLVTGQFDPEKNMAVWPSTGNYCRGGAYISRLLGCKSIAILPEEMSQERFRWLKNMADETIATPGSESNVKEIFDKCHELTAERGENVFVFNQFDQLGNHLWHYVVTGPAMEKVLGKIMGPRDRVAGACISSGSAGTTASGEYIKAAFPGAKLAVSEALQCPTLLNNGFGAHRIEGIGDKHVPWVHNVKNTDMVAAIDDEQAMRLFRLFNEPAGRDYLVSLGIAKDVVDRLHWLGISSICNTLTAIKFAKYFELTGEDLVTTVFTDGEDLYTSRLEEMNADRGPYTRDDAVADYAMLQQVGTDGVLELTYRERKRIHNLKYYTWVEQQGKTYDEINQQWYDRDYWDEIHAAAPKLDELIRAFNKKVRAFQKE